MANMIINSVTGSEIVTLQQVKDYVRIETTADDVLLATIISTAHSWCEGFLSRDIVAKNRTVYYRKVDHNSSYFNSAEMNPIRLPFAPVASIVSVTAEGSAAAYEIKGVGSDEIILNQSPALDVKVNYITQGLTDAEIKTAIFILCSTLYDNRTDFVTGTIATTLPINIRTILNPFKEVYI
jgi:hypothetical protein